MVAKHTTLRINKDGVKEFRNFTFPMEFSVPVSGGLFGGESVDTYTAAAIWWAGEKTVIRYQSDTGKTAYYDFSCDVFSPEKPEHTTAYYPFRLVEPTPGRGRGKKSEPTTGTNGGFMPEAGADPDEEEDI